MLQFIPENIDIGKLLEENPPSFPYHRDYFLHILSLLTEIPSRKLSLLKGNGYIPINAEIIKKRVHNYPRYLAYLVEHGVIETDNCYVPGEKSRAYRFSEQYRTVIVPASINKRSLLKSINSTSNYSRHMTARYWYLYKWMDGRIEIDFDKAKAWLWERFQQDIKDGKKNALLNYNARLAVAMQIKEGLHRFRVDRTSGRLHTLICSLKKELRQFVKYEGQQFVAIDIRCSQPTLSTVLLNPDFYLDLPDNKGMLNIHRVFPAFCKEVAIQPIRDYVIKNKEKFASYIEAVDGDLYLYMLQRLEEKGHYFDNRDVMKGVTFCTLFSSNRFIGQTKAWPKRMFRQLFPEVYKLFNMFKTVDSSHLAILLQRLEARLVLDNAAKKIGKAKPDMPILTVHDSIVVTKGNEEFCAGVIKNEADRLLGINLHLNTEPWFKPV